MPLSPTVSAVLILALSLAAQGLPLEVVNTTSEGMIQAPVTFGVPIPKIPGYVIPSLESHAIAVLNPSTEPIPHSYKVLSRWDGVRSDTSKSVKWVQVSFLADVPANDTVTYYLGLGYRPVGTLTANVFSDRIAVSPLPGTTFTIDTQALSLFREVVVDGQTIVAAPGGGLRMEDVNAVQLVPIVHHTWVESPGSVRMVVCQKGSIGDLRFTIRYAFHTGHRDVTVDFRLENPGAYGGFFGVAPATRYFDNLRLWLPVVGAGGSVTSSDGTWNLQGQVFEINQDFAWGPDPYNVEAGFYSETRTGSSVLHTSNRHDGAVEIPGSSGGVTVCVDRFWQNFPKTLRVSGNEVEVALWPEWGNGPEFRGQYCSPASATPIDPLAVEHYRFEGGRWKTHRVVFDFHTGARVSTDVARVSECTNRPLAGRAPPSWVAQTGATGSFWQPRRTWNDVGLDRWERFYEMLVDDNAADEVFMEGRIGFRAFRERGGTFGGQQFYGWESFGDIMWGNGASSLHYDWPYHMLMGWVRGGSYEFLDNARDMAWHRRDYDQNHSEDTAEWWRGAQSYEKGWWHGNSSFGQNSHNWVHGVLLHYALTGDEGSYEAAIQAQDFLIRNSPRHWTGYWGARIPGWATLNLVDCYDYLGDPAALNEAQAGVQAFQDLELAAGGAGHVPDPGSNLVAYPWMHAFMFNAAARYSLVAQDFQYLPLLDRMKNWLRSCVQTPSVATVMPIPTVTRVYHHNGTHEGQSVHHLWYLSESISLASLIFGQQDDIDAAYLLFETAARFHQVSAGTSIDFDDASTYSPIAMRMTNYPNAESKVLPAVLAGGHAYSALRGWLTGTSGQ